jgi:hypothetical protein
LVASALPEGFPRARIKFAADLFDKVSLRYLANPLELLNDWFLSGSNLARIRRINCLPPV